MACRGIDLEASPVAEDEDEEVEEVDRTAICEMEAAEALAGMARRRNLCDDRLGLSELQRPVSENLRSSKVASQLCTTSKLNSSGKSKPKLTEAEKEERKLRRILANRESARETIRRRKAMHLELAKKAVDELEENRALKKEKELAVAEYNSLKDRNKFLRAMLAKAKKPKQGVQEQGMTPSSEYPCSATTNAAISLHNQPPIVPCFWLSSLPSSEGFQFQYAAGSNPTNSSHFPMPYSLQGQENPADINQQGAPAPLFLVAVPWLLPFVSQTGASNFSSGADNTRNAHPHPHPHPLRVDTNQLSSSNQDMNTEASKSGRPGYNGVPGEFTSGRPVESVKRWRNTQQLDVSSAPESTFTHNSLLKNREPIANTPTPSPKKAEDAFSATMARKWRKELMRLKNIHCEYNNHLHYSAFG